MDNDLVDKEKQVQALQNRVAELERLLAKAETAALALGWSREDDAHTTSADHFEPKADRDYPGSLEERSRQAILVIPFPFMIHREDGKVVLINEAWTKITGYSLQDIRTVEQSIQKAYPDQDPEQQSSLSNAGVSSEGFEKWREFQVVSRLGERRIWDFRTAPLGFDRDGRQLLITLAVDITERKEAEEALAESERRQREITRLLELDQARLAAVLRHLPVGVWIADQHGRLIGSNEQADRIWGGETPLLNSTAEYAKFGAWYPETGNLLQAEEYPVVVALHTGQPVEPVELEIQRFDGSKGTVLASAAPIKDRQASLTGAVGVNVDISERKHTEEKLRAARDEAAWLARFPGENPNPVVRVSEAGIVLYRNPPAAKLPGWACETNRPLPAPLLALVQQAMAQRHLVRQDVLLGGRFYLVFVMPISGEKYANVYASDITDRKEAEEALRRSEERFQKAFHATPDAIIISRMSDGLIIEINEGWRKLFGHDPEEVIRRTSIELGIYLNPEDRKELIARLEKKGFLHNFELQIRRKSGEIRQASMSVERLEVNGMSCLLTVMRDITERKQAERALRESERRLNRAQEIAHLGSWELDLENNRLTWSDEVYRIFGLQPQEFAATYQAFLEAVHPDDRAVVDAAYSASIQTGRDRYEIEHRVIKQSSGEVRIVHEKCEHFRNQDGRIIRSFGMVHDITERKRAEKALRKSEERFRSLADSMPQLVWTALPDGTVDYYNERYQEYWEIKHTEGDAWEWAPVLHPDDLQSTVDAWQRSLATGEIYHIEHRVRMAGGSYRWHLSRGVPMLDESGQVVHWFGTATDIHELKSAEEKLKIYAERLERSSRE